MNRLIHIISILVSLTAAAALSSCSDSTSYTDLLNEESRNVNLFLADHKVIGEIPADTIFETGPDAPYYMLDEEGKLFMQVIDAGSGPKAKTNQLIYFRYTRYNLTYYLSGQKLPVYDTNDGAGYTATYFRYGDNLLQSSTEWGVGIQTPLSYLPINCHVKLVVKAEYGITTESTDVQPMLFDIRYYPSQL